jgi:hypothetical protein
MIRGVIGYEIGKMKVTPQAEIDRKPKAQEMLGFPGVSVMKRDGH